MIEKEFICVVCPNGCSIKAQYEEGNPPKLISAEGMRCPRGKTWIQQEIENPMRTFSTSVLVDGGDFIEALSALSATGEEKAWFDRFVELMRLAYTRNARGMKAWSEKLADLPREQDKAFLLYSQRMLRENFVYNFHCPQMVYMSPAEQQFAVRFAPFINERNCIGIMEELDLALRHVEQNVNAKMVFFDLALQIAVLIRHR